jgi:hypothetical protein
VTGADEQRQAALGQSTAAAEWALGLTVSLDATMSDAIATSAGIITADMPPLPLV